MFFTHHLLFSVHFRAAESRSASWLLRIRVLKLVQIAINMFISMPYASEFTPRLLEHGEDGG